MKASIIKLCLLSALTLSCRSGKKAIENHKASITIELHEGNWVSNFKNEVFIQCLKKMYTKNLPTILDSVDASSSANVDQLQYNREVLHIAESLAERFVKRPEASWTIEGVRTTLNVCLAYRNSAELDSISLAFYHKYYKKE